jgi:hypothetical protein
LTGEHHHLLPKPSPTKKSSDEWIWRILIGFFVGFIALGAGFLIGLFIMPPGENPAAWERQRLALQDDRRQWESQQIRWAHARQQYQQDRHDWEIQRASYAQDRIDWELEREAMGEEREAMGEEREAMGEERSKFEAEFKNWQSQRAEWALQREQWQREKKRYDGSYPEPAPGAFWSKPEIAEKCHSYGKREYTARIWNVPGGWSWENACKTLPNEFHGITFISPDSCENRGDRGMWGHWIVGFGEIECQPMLRDFSDAVRRDIPIYRVLLNTVLVSDALVQGQERRYLFHCRLKLNPILLNANQRVEAEITDIREEDDWQLMCGMTPAVIDGIHYDNPSHCEERVCRQTSATFYPN